WGEAVGGVEDVRFAPTDELLAGFDRQLAARPDGAHPPDSERRTGGSAVEPIEPQPAIGLAGRVRLRFYGAREAEPGEELVRCLVPQEAFRNGLAAVIEGSLRITEQRSFEEAALAEVLGRGSSRHPDGHDEQLGKSVGREAYTTPSHCSRLSACT